MAAQSHSAQLEALRQESNTLRRGLVSCEAQRSDLAARLRQAETELAHLELLLKELTEERDLLKAGLAVAQKARPKKS